MAWQEEPGGSRTRSGLPVQPSSARSGLWASPAARSLHVSPPWLLSGHPASDQSLHLCASVFLSMAEDSDAEGDDKDTKGMKNAWNKEGAS